ncbi:MAG: McrC family protein, partial [Candidatus Nanohaloarchaea archaeon]
MVQVSEYSDVELELTDEDFQFIQDKVNDGNENKPKIRLNPSDTQGSFKLRPEGHVGVVKLPSGKRIEIKPKIGTVKLLHIWNYVSADNNLSYEDLDTTSLEEGTQFLDIIAEIYQKEVQKIIRRGLYRDYVEKEERSNFVKGKVLVEKQIQSPYRDKMHVKYEDITENNKLNKLILHATDVLRRRVNNRELSSKLNKQYKKIRKSVDEERITKGELNEINTDTLSNYYEKAVLIAKQVVRNTYYESISTGQAPAYSFLINMNRLFQDFVTKLMREIYPEKSVNEKPRNLFKTGKIRIRPDLLVSSSQGTEIVGDVKYMDSVGSSEFQQAIAYGLSEDTDCFLVRQGKGEIRTYEMEKKDIRAYE